jgi:lipopolysaccharide transport system permease protein
VSDSPTIGLAARVRDESPRWEITSEVPGALASLQHVWTYRQLVDFLGRRTVQRIYRRTILGWLWLFIRPLFPLTLRVLVFGGLLGVGSDGVPYFLFLLAGTVVWDLFGLGAMWGTRALELHGDIQDVYIPRIIMPIGAFGPAMVDVLIKIAVLVLTTLYFWVHDGRMYVVMGPSLVLAAAALLLAGLFALAISLFTSLWNEETKDARYALMQVLGVWYFLTPVLYPMSAVPEEWRGWMLLNPMAWIVETFKYGLLGIGELDLVAFGISAATVFGLLGLGIQYFASRDAATIDAR